MSYRMIIADDEEMLIQLIRKLGRFGELGIEIVDECHDGETACASILRNRPDFVLTDIQMPAMDGLEIIGRVQREAPEILFVLLSGYRYFEYARSAVQLNAVDYLLKPVDAEQLNTVLERLCRMIDERRRQEKEKETLRSFQDRDEQERSARFWDALMEGREGAPQDVTGSLPGETLREPLIRIMIADLQMTRTSGARFSIEEKMEALALASFEGKCIYRTCHRKGQFLAMLNYSEKDKDAVRGAVGSFYYGCRELHDVFGEFRITIGLSGSRKATEDLRKAAEEAKAAVWGRLYFMGDQLIHFDQVKGMERVAAEQLLPADLARRLGENVRGSRRGELAEVFAALKEKIVAHPYIYPGDVKQLAESVTRLAEMAAPEPERERLREGMEEAARSAESPQQLLARLYREVDGMLEEQAARIEQAGRRPARHAEQYIRTHYAQGISLESAAEAAGVSPSYLSRLFKELHGTGFNEYLTEVRLEESRKLLSDTNMPIREVAASVGYPDEKYYARLFRKQFGIKPTEYRKLYG